MPSFGDGSIVVEVLKVRFHRVGFAVSRTALGGYLETGKRIARSLVLFYTRRRAVLLYLSTRTHSPEAV